MPATNLVNSYYLELGMSRSLSSLLVSVDFLEQAVVRRRKLPGKLCNDSLFYF